MNTTIEPKKKKSAKKTPKTTTKMTIKTTPKAGVQTDSKVFTCQNVSIPKEVLCNLAARFILSMPEDEMNDPIRICFQMELAFWYYTDSLLNKYDEKLPTLKLRMFAYIMFHYLDRLKKFLPVFDEVIGQWIEYKFSIPTYGAILLDATLDYVLLVQGFGSKTWGFPKGKQNHSENPMLCASREVYEEIGYNCMNRMRESDYLERKVHASKCRLYIITDVAMDYPFEPHVVNEIRDIQWFNVAELPVRMANVANEQFANKFYSVSPFVYSLQKWIRKEKKRRGNVVDDKQCRRTRYNSVGEAAQKSDDSGTNSPYHMVETGPDMTEGNSILNALFAAQATVQSEREMHTKNVYHADLQHNLKTFTEKKNWPEVWQSLVNHYNSETDEQHSSKVDYDLKSKLSNNGDRHRTVGLDEHGQNMATSGQDSNGFHDKLTFLFNIASADKRTPASGWSTPVNCPPNGASNGNKDKSDAVRKLFSTPQPEVSNGRSSAFAVGSNGESNGGNSTAVGSCYKGLTGRDAQALSQPMARLMHLLGHKRG